MTKFKLGSSAVAALLISSMPALAQDTTVRIDQSLDQELNQTCSGTAMGTDGYAYSLTTTSSGDCVAVQLGVNDVDIQSSFNGQTTGDRTLIIDQELLQELNQTGGGSGDTTAVQAGGNFVDVRGSFNGPTFEAKPGDHDDMDEDKDHDDMDEDKDHDDMDEDKDHDDGMNNGNNRDRDNRGGQNGNNGYGNGGNDGSPNGKQDRNR